MSDLSYSDCPVWFDIYQKYQQKYRRIGECCRCGDCCLTVVVEVNWNKLEYKVVEVENKKCKSWDDKTKCCSNYLFRSIMCRLFPMQPSDLDFLLHCTYRFEEIESDKILKGSG